MNANTFILLYHLNTFLCRGRSEEEVWAEVREHDQIITIFLLHELNKFKVKHPFRLFTSIASK